MKIECDNCNGRFDIIDPESGYELECKTCEGIIQVDEDLGDYQSSMYLQFFRRFNETE